jgi:uncharacterized membrane protein YagU involved in acid resistance
MKTILIAGLIAGTLDLDLAVAFFSLRGAPLDAIPHAIAAGLLGPRAFHGGIAIAFLGVALHYFIALSVASFYYFLSLRTRFLNSHPLLSGAVYGIGVYLFMQYVVLPLSAEPRSSSGHAWLIADVASHIFFIGITIALITRFFSNTSPATP